MPKFSQRYGYTQIEKSFQRERVEMMLRTKLWNVLSLFIWNKWEQPLGNHYTQHSERINILTRRVWFYYFGRDMDALPIFKSVYSHQKSAYVAFKEYFLACKWFEVYDFIEFLLQSQEIDIFLDDSFIQSINIVLETENAAYRIVVSEVVEITDTNEIAAIEAALNHPDAPVRAHIQTALTMLSDRKSPDYRNSIKESISAVEATCRLVTSMKTATLGDALKKVTDLHPALQKGFLALYGFTSDASGIRHSLLEESNLTYADAKFMLSACSSFVSYLRSSANET